MRINRYFIIVAAFAASIVGQAQTNNVGSLDMVLLEQARSYFDSGDYAVSYDFLRQWNASEAAGRQDAVVREEVESMLAVATADANPVVGKLLLADFLDRHPKSPWRNRVMAMTGVTLARTGEYGEALEWLELSDNDRLTLKEARRSTFYRIVSLFKTGRTTEGYVMLNVLKNLSLGEYDDDIAFYNAYVDYCQNKMDDAVVGFTKSYGNKSYADWSGLYLADIALHQNNPDEAARIAGALLDDDVDESILTEAERILGEARFMQGNWKDADEMLTSYVMGDTEPTRLDLYQLGMANWELGEYARAMEFLGRVTDDDDEISQNAWMHRGLASLALGDTASAVFDFERASSMNGNRAVTEQALYNYAMCLQESGYAPFAEPVTAFERFLNEFPESRYHDVVSKRLVGVYLQSSNYDAALNSIGKIHNPDAAVLAAKQKLLFSKGVELYVNGKYDDAAQVLTEVTDMSKYDSQLAADACFWRGETYFRKAKAGSTRYYQQAAKEYSRYLTLTSDNRLSGQALYSSGYVAYNTSDWQKAMSEWTKLTGRYSSSVSKQVLADAYARLGDCRFYRHEYTEAEENYGKSIETYRGSGDYSLFRSGMCRGLRKDYNGKIEVMERLCREYPTSEYCAQSLYEEGRAYLQMERSKEAIDVFARLSGSYAGSDYSRKALAETALIYYQNDEYEKAIPAYKNVIAKYPGSEEAVMAMRDLKSVYVEMGRVDDYISYTESVSGFAPVEADEKDSLTYASAEILFTRGNRTVAAESFEKYLKQYPDGARRLDANYYLGLIYIDSNQNRKALDCLKTVTANENSRFYLEALTRVAPLAYEMADYRDALDAYAALAARSGSAQQTASSLLGAVRSAFASGDHAAVVKYADKALESRIEENERAEVRYDKAKSLQSLGRQDEAQKEFTTLMADMRSAYGAESSYIVSRMLFDKGNLEASEKNIRDLISSGTPHTYWLARSFVLLSDIYMAQDKTIEAKQYLLSLRQNYQNDDDIAGMIDERLEGME